MQRHTIPSAAPSQPLKLERLASVTARTGLSRTTIWRRVKEGSFPAPVRIGTQSVAWPSFAVDGWIESCIDGRNGGAR